MKNSFQPFFLRKLFVLLLFTSIPLLSTAQNVLVSGAIVGNGTYPTLASAFTAINSGSQAGANIIVYLTGSTTETVTATLNQGTWGSFTIYPAGGAARTVSGDIAGPLVDFNGADIVFIDGLNTGGNSLTFNNINTTSASTFRFINDASGIFVQNCSILGSNTSTTSGTIFFSTSAGGAGNDNIGFNNCTIDLSGVNNPTNGVYSAGTAVASQENSTINFTSCNIPNFYNTNSVSTGILAATGNTDWTITGCRFYQSASRNYTTGSIHRAIQISSGNNHSITSNTIGFATSAGTGTYTMTGAVATRFIAIDMAVGTTTASSVQGNTISSISLSTSSGASTANGILCGINITSGNVNIGTISPNSIGSTSGTGSLSATTSTTQGAVVGINCSSTGTIVIQNNLMGGFSSIGSGAAIAGSVFGINISGLTASMTISGNTIGSSVTNNMVAGTLGVTTGATLAAGINAASNAITLVVSNNTIQNFASYGTGAGYVRGFFTATTGSTNSTISGNTVRNLTTSSSLTAYTSGIVSASGIHLASGNNAIISGNTIHNISNINTGTANTSVIGISMAQATNTSTFNNVIYDLANAGTGTTAAAPPIVCGIMVRSGTTSANIHNNMISIGSGQTTNTTFIGIWGNHGSTPDPIDNIYHNTVNITGTAASGALSSFCFQRGTLALSPGVTVNIKNNIFTNSRTGGTGIHYAISNNFGGTATATGWGAGNTNNNVLNANASSVGYWNGQLTFVNWQTTSSCDAASLSGITVAYVNPVSNLHLNMGVTPTLLESSGQTIPSVTTDIDGQTRPGPAGSVNGGAFLPDLGADEFDGVPLDAAAPIITYTPLTFTCGFGDRTVTATIADISGVPTTGALQPRIYFRKNGGAWFSNQGTLTSGTGINGTWDFTITSATVGGVVALDVIDYFVIAQDIITPTPNIRSNPSTGLVASDVNTVTTAPTTPNSYPISDYLTGTYTVGTGGDYPTLTDAANSYNTSCLGGPIIFSLIDPNYSASEIFPITFNSNPDANSTNTLTIKPTIAGTIIAGSSATSIIKFNGADYVELNGSISSTVNSVCSPVSSASMDLIITNNATSAATAVIWFASAGDNLGATNNILRNCVLMNGVDQSVSATENYGVVSCGATITTFPPPDGLDNNDNLFENNSITKTTWGIYLRGEATSSNTNNIIRQNLIGPSAFGSNQIRKGGIIIQNQDQTIIEANEVRFVGNQVSQAVGGTDHIGIGVGGADGPTPTTTNVTNSSIIKNNVHDIVCEKTFSAIGIEIAVSNATASNNVIANNTISNVRTNATSPDQGIGINVSNGNGDQIIFNSINMVTADRDPAGSTTASESDICVRFQAGALNPVFENNVTYMDESSNTASLKNFVVVAPAAGYPWGTGVSNYNDYSINASGAQNVLFGLGTTGAAIPQVTTLAAWQTTFTPNQDANSLNIVPVFTSATDLHLVAASNTSLANLGTPVGGITIDYDCETRTATPDMGADEFCYLADIPVVSVSINPICSGDTTMLTLTGNLNESSGWEWYSVSCGGTSEASNDTAWVSPSSTTDYFVRGEGGCSSVSLCGTVTITVNPLPLVGYTVNLNDSICPGDSVSLSGTNANTYTWTGGITNGINFSPVSSGTYTVTGTDLNGCSNTTTADITVFNLPTVSYTALANDSVCLGGNVTLSGTGANIYSWSGGITDAVLFTPAVSDTFIVTGTDLNGCSNTDTAEVYVLPLPVVSYTVAANDTICLGTSITLSGMGAGSYAWSGGVTNGNSFAPSGSGTYTVTGTDANGCTNTTTANITVNSLPTVNLGADIVQPSPPALLDAGAGFSSYLWSTSAVTQTISVSTNGTFNVTVTDANGCTDSDTINVTFTAGIQNADGSIGIIQLYPIPSDGSINLSIQNIETENMTIFITDLQGSVVKTFAPFSVSGNFLQTFDITMLSSGMYVMQIQSNGKSNQIRFIKK